MSQISDKRTEILALVVAMILPFLASLLYFVLFKESSLARGIYGLTKVFTLVWPYLIWRILRKRPVPELELNSPTHRQSLPWGIISGLAIGAALLFVMHTPVGETVYAHAPQIRAKALSLGYLDHFWTLAILLSFVHSFVEEYYWRWYVYGTLREFIPRTGATLLSAAAFSAHHFVILSQYVPANLTLIGGLAVLVGGLIWNEMYERQKTLAGAWVSHIIVDVAIMFVGYLLLFPEM